MDRETIDALGITVEDLWLAYIAVGGSLRLIDFDGFINRGERFDDDEQECLDHALAELRRAGSPGGDATAGDAD